MLHRTRLMQQEEFVDLVGEYPGHDPQLMSLEFAQWFFWFVIKVSAGLCELFGSIGVANLFAFGNWWRIPNLIFLDQAASLT